MSAHQDGDDLERGDKVRGGSVIVSVMPSRWQSIGCVTARLVNEEGRKRVQPPTALTNTHHGATGMALIQHTTGKAGGQ